MVCDTTKCKTNCSIELLQYYNITAFRILAVVLSIYSIICGTNIYSINNIVQNNNMLGHFSYGYDQRTHKGVVFIFYYNALKLKLKQILAQVNETSDI